jgi:hypothetical protein
VQNRLLASLPEDVMERISPYLVPSHLSAFKALHEFSEHVRYAYFPVDCVISYVCFMSNGASVEIASCGNDGVVGLAHITGTDCLQGRAIVQCAGGAYRLAAEVMRREFEHAAAFRSVVLRYMQSLIAHMAQTAACYRHHSLEQQLCRWILVNADRLPGGELRVTQESIANLLGVSREGVTQAAVKLQRDGLIHYGRAHIFGIDSAALEARACECYGAVKRTCERVWAQR